MARVRVVRPYSVYAVGDVIPEMPGILADQLCRAGFVERLDDRPKAPAEERAVRPEPETATHRRKSRRD